MNKILYNIKKFVASLYGKKENTNNHNNPWAGLASYEDPLRKVNPLKFCGRKEESLDVFRLIDDNLVVTLYGKSGIGKTSLLNAGVFPILRKNNYAPIYVRFVEEDFKGTSFADQVIQKLNKCIVDDYGEGSIETINVIPENSNSESEDYLWSFFARRKFIDRDGNQIFPVIILDQFEENIRLNRTQAILLLKQIMYMSNRQNMLKDTFVENAYYTYNYNFRFVISIREDDLFRLEDIINSNYLSHLRNCRYRLQNLSNESAQEIVKNVGADFIAPEEVSEISKRIINVARDNEDNLIQTNVISLVCARLFNLVSKQGRSNINLRDVEDYLSKDPFEEYYTSSVKKLSEGEKRFIEDRLVTTDGRRTLLPESTLKESIKSYEELISGETSIIHRIQSASGEYRVELIHDGLCPAVIKHRSVRLEKKNRTILSLCLFIFGIIGIWLLNTSIVNGFVRFFLSISTVSKLGISTIGYFDVLSVIELISIILFPIAIGSVVYDYSKKKIIALSALTLYCVPYIIYPRTFLDYLIRGIVKIIECIKHADVQDFLSGLSDRTIVFIVYTIILLLLCGFNLFGKSGIIRKDSFFKLIWCSLSVKVYLFVIAAFLFYRSIFNTGYFVVDSFDSSWGIVIIPLLVLNIFGSNLRSKKNKVVFCLYISVLVILMISSIFELFIRPQVQLFCIVVSFLILCTFYYKNNVFSAIYKSTFNAIILALVLFLQLGYNPLTINSQNISKVYPWKILVSDNSNNFGVYDARYGDTILIPEFQKDTSSYFNYYKIISSNAYINTISNDTTVGDGKLPFPLKLSKIGTGKWKLSLQYSPNYEYAISSLAHTTITDSTMLSNKKGALLFLKLRNDISKFCITGDDSILKSDISNIISYEETVRVDLVNSLRHLKNDTVITEIDVVPFIKALSRSLYLNMLKEAILKGHYNDFIGWYSDFYIATSLTSVTAENGIRWSASNQSNSFSVTLDGLNDDKIYAWNNLYYALFLLECNAYALSYYSGMERKLEEDQQIIASMFNISTELLNKLKNHSDIFEKQYDNLQRILTNLTDSNNKGDKLSSEDFLKTINVAIEVKNISNNVKHGISNDVGTYYEDITNLSDSLCAIEPLLANANIQFEHILTDTFNPLLEIITKNPDNAYNGLFISLCQKLYVIGVIRGYNMENYSSQMNDIEKIGIPPMYNFVRQTDNAFKTKSQLLESVKSQIGINRLKVNQLLERKH